jgi:hypothetical protein
MMDTKELLADKRFPGWIRDHSVFKVNKKIDKIFPHIGLSNCNEECSIDNSREAIQSAKYLLNDISRTMSERSRKLANFAKKKETPTAERKKMNAKRKAKYENCQLLLGALSDTLTKNPDKLITANNGKITLNLTGDVKDSDGTVVFKSGEGLFRVYNKLSDMLSDGKFVPLQKLDNLTYFKDFSSKNVPSDKFRIVFSSDGTEGLWDIATMSMRGISSCQTWGGGNATHVVGSMVDPFTGIIYLTSGAKHGQYGSKMLRRCVVRFIVNEKTKKQYIYLERMYPALDQGTKDTFIKFIEQKTDKKYPVVYGPDVYGQSMMNGTYVPMANIIKNMQPADHPYRDSGMPYKTDPLDTYGSLKEKMDVIFSRVSATLGSKVLSTARIMKIASIPEESKDAFRNLRGTSYYGDYSYLVYEDLAAMCKRYFNGLDPSKFNNVNEFVKHALTEFSTDLPAKVQETIAESCKTRKIGKIDAETLEKLATLSSKKVLEFMKDELKKITISKKAASKTSGKLELPEEVPVYIKLLN